MPGRSMGLLFYSPAGIFVAALGYGAARSTASLGVLGGSLALRVAAAVTAGGGVSERSG